MELLRCIFTLSPLPQPALTPQCYRGGNVWANEDSIVFASSCHRPVLCVVRLYRNDVNYCGVNGLEGATPTYLGLIVFFCVCPLTLACGNRSIFCGAPRTSSDTRQTYLLDGKKMAFPWIIFLKVAKSLVLFLVSSAFTVQLCLFFFFFVNLLVNQCLESVVSSICSPQDLRWKRRTFPPVIWSPIWHGRSRHTLR